LISLKHSCLAGIRMIPGLKIINGTLCFETFKIG
jgi:hypothetical protein